MAYPYSKAETIADGAVHAAGLLLAIPAAALLLAQQAGNVGNQAGLMVYLISLIAAFVASAIYHMSPIDRTRALLGRIDHAAIYLKIAGTYTPVVVIIGGGFAYGLLGLVWALAVFGAVAKLWFWPIDGKGSLALYLGMGWLSVLLVWPIWNSLGGLALSLIIGGGVIYSAGTIIYAHPGMRYQNAIWHLFVLLASACFFAAIALSV